MKMRAITFVKTGLLGVVFLLSACQMLGLSGMKVDPKLSDPSALVFHNGTVITATGEDPIPQGAVLIQGGLITAVGPENKITIPHDATVIDVEGRTIMPGLIEGRASDLLNRLELEDGQISGFSRKLYLGRALYAGVTTLRATGWDWEKQQYINEMRAALETLGNTVPTVVIAGTSLTHGEGAAYTVYYPDQLVGVVTPEETRQTTEQLIELGVDQISLVMTLTKDPGVVEPDPYDSTLTPEQLKIIVEVAHDHGKRVLAQTIFKEDTETVLAAGVDEIISWPILAAPLPDDLLDKLVERSVPVLSGFNIVQPQPGDVRRFLDAGGTLVIGTFAPNGQPLESMNLEFQRMLKEGMTPMEIVQAATKNAAQALGLGDTLGTLEAGKQADIIVIDGDLLENIRAVKDVVYVVKNGELVVQQEEGQ